MPMIQIEKEQLLRAVLQMPGHEFDDFVRRAHSLKARERADALPEREAELLSKIYEPLPAATQARLNRLIEKRQAETLNAKEQKEHKKLTDQIEAFDATRLEWLVQLAQLRHVPLRRLIKQLGLKPVPHD